MSTLERISWGWNESPQSGMNLPGQEWELSGLEWVWTNRTVTRVSYICEDSGTESSWVVVHIVAANPEEAHEYQQAAAVEEMTRVAEGESLAAEPALVLRAGEESRGV